MNQIERLPIDSDLLRTFLAIAECANLTEAASRLGRTQSAISVQLRRLESGLDTTLFKRTAKGMQLTGAGEQLLPKARSILAEMKQVSALFKKPLTGKLTVGLPDDFDNFVLERALTAFSRDHEGVEVEAISGCTAAFPEAVRKGELDIAVYSRPDNEEGDALCVEDIVWAAASAFVHDASDPVPLAVLDRGCWWKDLATDALKSVGQDHKVVFRSSSFSGFQAAIRAGFAIGVLPESSVGAGLKKLSHKKGWPALPRFKRSILISSVASSDLTGAMARAIRDAHGKMPK